VSNAEHLRAELAAVGTPGAHHLRDRDAQVARNHLAAEALIAQHDDDARPLHRQQLSEPASARVARHPLHRAPQTRAELGERVALHDHAAVRSLRRDHPRFEHEIGELTD
jgi:hypothetical protein